MTRVLSFALLAALGAGCYISVPVSPGRDGGGPPVDAPAPPVDAPPVDAPHPCTTPAMCGPTDKLDLLFVVDNSNSMRENQFFLATQIEPMVRRLIDPPCVSDADPTPHACDPSNPADRRQFPPARDVHVGIVSSDLGTYGTPIPGCVASDTGDDGRLNPLHAGPATLMHQTLRHAPVGFRPADCDSDPVEARPYLEYRIGSTDVAQFSHAVRCTASLYIGGCGLEQQLEAAYRALTEHGAGATAGGSEPHAGFLREDAVLAIVMLTDEEDMSVRPDARTVFDPTVSSWASPNLNLRSYMYRPGSAEDPTYSLDRYINPRDSRAGFLGLKPGRPDRVVFAAITGVPLAMPRRTTGAIDWDALLGAPDPANRDNFNGRNGVTAYTAMSAEGPISMRPANIDTACSERVVPACRREGTMYNPAAPQCSTVEQYFAWPSRRVVEVARRFDESPLCGGRPCRNGIVASVCGGSYAPVVDFIAQTCLRRMAGDPD